MTSEAVVIMLYNFIVLFKEVFVETNLIYINEKQDIVGNVFGWMSLFLLLMCWH